MSVFAEMMARHARPGRIERVLIRPERLAAPAEVTHALLEEGGLQGDHARPGKRALTLIQAEHLPVIGALLGQGPIDAALLRRNLVVAGINLAGLKGRRVRIGGAVIEVTGICAPCSRMEAALGSGGYTAVRGHGGWCACVVTPGEIGRGNPVEPLQAGEE
ncbi:MAG: MOSC domain-containing protein [Sulfitobacter sp.]|nr:MOSC domain-containing protein [Sulfitobacter sp.]